MERRLWIVRHAKSSWEYEDLEDIYRPLAERGIRNAGEMAERLMKRGMVPRLILTSPATRALNTALIMSKVWSLEPSALQVHEPLYMAYAKEIADVVAGVPPEVTELAIYGHNPSFTGYANTFLADPLDNLPTAGVVVVTLESDSWEGIGPAQVTSTYVDYPKKNRG